MKRTLVLGLAGLVLLPFLGCNEARGPGHFDNDASCGCENTQRAELRTDAYRDVAFDAPRGATARELAASIGSDIDFQAGGDRVIQVDGTPDALNGSAHGQMSQDMAELMLRSVMEMQVDPHTGLPLYTVTVAESGDRPTVKANPILAAETMKSQK